MLIVSGICAHHQKELKSVCKEINGIDYDMSVWEAVRERVFKQIPNRFYFPFKAGDGLEPSLRNLQSPTLTYYVIPPYINCVCLFVRVDLGAPNMAISVYFLTALNPALVGRWSLLVCKGQGNNYKE